MLYKEFIEKFSFNGDEDYNYVLRGGEIFNYIGMTVNMITYVRKPNGEIKTEENPVIIEDISDLDETLTYKIKVEMFFCIIRIRKNKMLFTIISSFHLNLNIFILY